MVGKASFRRLKQQIKTFGNRIVVQCVECGGQARPARSENRKFSQWKSDKNRDNMCVCNDRWWKIQRRWNLSLPSTIVTTNIYSWPMIYNWRIVLDKLPRIFNRSVECNFRPHCLDEPFKFSSSSMLRWGEVGAGVSERRGGGKNT